MYSTVGLIKYSKHSGKLIGAHQRLDRAARTFFSKIAPKNLAFPTYKEIVHFEGMQGPDGLKRKSPGKDEPMHFIIPDQDDGRLIRMISDHQYNLKKALATTDKSQTPNLQRAAFEAAWLAHALTDGLTPAHHFPYAEAVKDLMSDKDYYTIFGQPVKGIMRGDTFLTAAKNNWKYWGVEGLMTKHIVFEYRVALILAAMPYKKLSPNLDISEQQKLSDYGNLDLEAEFYAALKRINGLKMYDRFREDGWSRELARETKEILLPEIVKIITIGWLSSLPSNEQQSSKGALPIPSRKSRSSTPKE